MKRMMKKFLVTSLAAVSLVTVGAGVAAVPANADVATTSMVTRLTGAAARVTAEDSGLRFFAKIDREQYGAAAAAGEVKVGMIIVPVEYIAEAGGYTHEALIAKYTAEGIIDVSYDETQVADYELYAASIIDLKDANYTREFTAIPYISVDGAYSYGTADVTGEDYVRSVYEVASKAYVSENETAETKAVLKGYLDGVVDIKNEDGVVSIANNTADYTSPYVVTEKAEGVWEVRPTQENALKTNRINAKSMLYNGARKTDFHVVDGETEIHTIVTGGDDEGDIKEPITFNYNRQEGVISLKGRQTGGTPTIECLNQAITSYIAFKGNYGPGTYLDMYFTGNNMPQLIFYADQINGLWGTAGGKGLVLSSGIRNTADSITRGDDFLVFGPNRITTNYINGSQLLTFGDSAAGTDTDGSDHPLSQAYMMARSTTEFKYTVGTFAKDGLIYLDLYLYAKDIETGEYKLICRESPSTKQTVETMGTGSIILCAGWTGSIGLDSARTTFTYSAPYASSSTFMMSGSTINEDGSVTLKGVRPTHAGYGSGVGAPNGWQNSYIAWKGEYGLGYYTEFTYTGNNMPYVMFYADSIDGYIGGNRATDRGIILTNGIVDAGNGTNTDYLVYDTFAAWGPNRYRGDHYGSKNYKVVTAEYPALLQSALNTDAYKNTKFKYVVGTFGNTLTDTVCVDVTLYNLDESATEPMYSFTLDTKISVETVTAGSIVAYAPMKGYGDGTAAQNSTFSYKEPYFVKTKAVVTSGATKNEDGSVTLKNGGDMSAGAGWGSGLSKFVNSCVGFIGEYGVGTYVQTIFKGNNMPQVLLFADEVNPYMGKGGASYPSGKENTGYIINNGIWANSGSYQESTGSNYLMYQNFLYVQGPNRISVTISASDVNKASNLTYAEGKEYTGLDENTTYIYIVGSYENADGKVVIDVELYDQATGEIVVDAEYATGKTVEQVQALGGNIVLYAGIKGAGVDTTFTYALPVDKKPTVKK